MFACPFTLLFFSFSIQLATFEESTGKARPMDNFANFPPLNNSYRFSRHCSRKQCPVIVFSTFSPVTATSMTGWCMLYAGTVEFMQPAAANVSRLTTLHVKYSIVYGPTCWAYGFLPIRCSAPSDTMSSRVLSSLTITTTERQGVKQYLSSSIISRWKRCLWTKAASTQMTSLIIEVLPSTAE